MREIKFRGYGIFEWCYGSLVVDNGKYYIVEEINVENTHGDGTDFYATVWSEVTKETIGQYTGQKDINGVEIYEGDKIHDTFTQYNSNQKESKVNTIFYDKRKGSLCTNLYPCGVCFIGEVIADKRHSVEVIGNIYEI